MCGIVGYAGLKSDGLLRRMCGVIRHRGPDDEGVFYADDVALGNRRLSIIDVEGGNQPIYNENGRLAVVHNGEIYNFQEVMKELEARGHRFKTRSDTEVIVHAYEEYGPECVHRLNGMFAFALYDQDRRRLFIARDRLGVKPLYYTRLPGGFLFASEIKALLEHEGVSRCPNLSAIDDYLAVRFVPGPDTLFKGIRKLPPGHRLFYSNGQISVERYWKVESSLEVRHPDEYYRERFAELLESSVRLRMISDVPFGAFLSGGLDSSVIVGLMSRELRHPVKTFSVGFESADDELGKARAVARYFGCEHTEFMCRPRDWEYLPRIVWHLDEPIGDAIVLPMFLLSQKARQTVKMVLTGEGADEILAGYVFHKALYWWFRAYQRPVPRVLRRRLVRPLLGACPAEWLSRAFNYPAALGRKGKHKLVRFLDLSERLPTARACRDLVALFDESERGDLWLQSPQHSPEEETYTPPVEFPVQNGKFLDELLLLPHPTWLADNMLRKQDKLTMANSIEGREPYLDYRLVEFLATVPPHLKIKGLTEKRLLRDYGRKLLPQGTSRQVKRPFYMPAENYLNCSELKKLTAENLNEDRVRRRGLFRWEPIQHLLRDVQSGEFVYAKQLIALLTLELWFRIFIDREQGLID